MVRWLIAGFLAALLFVPCTVFGAGIPPSPASVIDNSRAAWELFQQGCLMNNQDIAGWATDKTYLVQSQKVTAKQMAQFSKLFGYPTEDKPATMWSLHNSYTTMVAYENHGCAVVSDSYIAPEILQHLIPDTAASLTRLGAYVGKIQTHIDEKNNGYYVLMPVQLSGATDASYVLLRTFPEGMVTHLKTMLYVFDSPNGYNLDTGVGAGRPVR